MVLAATKNGDDARNGRRSRGPSPNGHLENKHDSSEEENAVPADKIRVGRDFQAVCPELTPASLRKPENLADRALLVWAPTIDIPDSKLEEYIILAKDKFGYNGEQALGMLFWHKHDLDRAISDLANFTPFPDEWTNEDTALFEQAFQFHGKSFHRIRQMLPEKTIASLVKYYYGWKKHRGHTSQIDKQVRKMVMPRRDGTPSEDSSEGGSNEETEHNEKKWTIHRGIRRENVTPPRSGTSDENGNQGEGGACSNCSVNCTVTHVTPKGTWCTSCFHHYRRTGMLRPTTGATGSRRGIHSGSKHKCKPPRGMYINHDDLTAMASGAHGIQLLDAMDRELEALHHQIQHNKQLVSSLKRKHSETVDDLRPASDSRINSKWTTEELSLAAQGARRYGRDYKSIAEVLGNKTESHIRSFFINYNKRYNLDMLVKEYENDPNSIVVLDDLDDRELDGTTNLNSSNDVICLSPSPPLKTSIKIPN